MNLNPTFKTYPAYNPLKLSLASKVLLLMGTFFFSLSLPLTSLFTSGDDIQGAWILLIGWLGIIIFQFAWFANPLNLLALLLLTNRPKIAFLLSSIALILASQALIFSEIPTSFSESKIYIQELGLGFYCWYAAHVMFLLATLIEVFKRAQKSEG
ncbi:MAG: hypothetical protein V3U64_05785 [Cocleimonas sp.]